MIDVLESKEAAAEKRADDMHVDADHYRCLCGKITPNEEMHFLSPDSYCPPSCGDCFDRAFNSR